MLRINPLRTLPFLAAAALGAAALLPSIASAAPAHSGGHGAGKVSYSDLSVTMSAYDPGFRGGVYVAAGDVDAAAPIPTGTVRFTIDGPAASNTGVTGRITSVAVDPSDPSLGTVVPSVTDLVIDPFNSGR
jgi:hypothetical protein